MTEHEIVDIQLLNSFQEEGDSGENRHMCEGAFKSIGSDIVGSQSLNVDVVSGATGSSNGIKSAVRAALKQAYMAGGISEAEAESAINRNFTEAYAQNEEHTVELHYDVVVVGAGASGTTASLTALDQGASVLNIEKTFRWGGQSMFTGGPKAYSPNTTDDEAQKIYESYNQTINNHRFGEEDQKWNDEEYRNSHEDDYTPVNESAYKAVVSASGKGIEKIVKYGMHFVKSLINLGDIDFSQEIKVSALENSMEMRDETGRSGNSFMDMMSQLNDSETIEADDVYEFDTSGSGTSLNYSEAQKYYETVFKNYVLAGGDYLLNTTAKELIYEDDTKTKIIGVRAYGKNGITYEVYASAVVLATGGYGGNESLMDEWARGGEDWLYLGYQGNDGDGIQMALDAGANPYNLDAYPMCHQRMGAGFITSFDTQQTEDGREWSPNDLTNVLTVNSDGVYITKEGKFFSVDENGIAGFSGAMGTYYLGSGYYVVYSSVQLKEYRDNGITDTTMGFQNTGKGIPEMYPLGNWVDTVLDKAVSQGWAWKVYSLEEGDAELNLEEGTLAAAYKAEGTERNREGAEYYYIIKGAGLAISSCGGVEVNESMQAVKEDGTVIENLFIAGNDGLGNIMATGAEYPIGGDAGMFVFGSGYIAGEKAAEMAIDETVD